MIQELANKVWSNRRFHDAAKAIERNWLSRELHLANVNNLTEESAVRAVSAAAILACSDNPEHRIAAHRLSTYVFDLFGSTNLPLDSALRVILTRLGNFPSLSTRPTINAALPTLPWMLAAEELAAADKCTVDVFGTKDVLTDFQNDLWHDLKRQRSLAFSAPTSGGKSFLLQLFVGSQFDGTGDKRVVYLVPTRALITQVSTDIAEFFRSRERHSPEVVTVPVRRDETPASAAIYVMTQERIHLLLQWHPTFRPDLIIIDEAQSISEGSRGILLQSAIDELLRRNRRAQTLFASPTTRNLELFGRVFSVENISNRTSKEPTVSQNFLIVTTDRGGGLSIGATREKRRIQPLGEVSTKLSMRSHLDKLAHIPIALCPNEVNLVYANGADDAELIALRIANQLEPKPQAHRLAALAKIAQESVHKKYVLAECVMKGVGFHYANIPTTLRLEIEKAFSKGDIRYLVSTNTLLQGVNLPAKNLFLLKPTKGKGTPIEAADFWNLAGRAGRLRREFQGNIFLIDYERWAKKPLSLPKDTDISPAIEKAVRTPEKLIAILEGRNIGGPQRVKIDLETAAVRLFDDFKNERLSETLTQMSVDDDSRAALRGALSDAATSITLPPDVIRRSHNVSVIKQQRLYDRLKAQIFAAPGEISRLIPLHPREDGAFDSYVDALKLCQEIILERDTSKKLHRFHALMAVRWMLGWSVPRIVDSQIRRHKGVDTRKIIRETLEMIESVIRFQTSRLFGCYNSILGFVLAELGATGLAASIPDVELFLEIGASNRTMVSLIALGLSRAIAIRLNGARLPAEPELGVEEALAWLRSQADTLESLGLSPLQIEEVRALMEQA